MTQCLITLEGLYVPKYRQIMKHYVAIQNHVLEVNYGHERILEI